MKNLYSLITIGVILASLAFYFEKSIPLLASIFALCSAYIFIKGANILRKRKIK